MLDIGPIHRREYEIDSGRLATETRQGKALARPTAGESKGKQARTGGIKRSSVEKQADKVAETVVIAQAPGRIHFLGEHGDPFAGLFLSAAIDRWIKVAVSPRKDNSLRFYAVDLSERKRTTLINLKFKREDRWANYIKSAINIFTMMGPVKGMNFTVVGNIPQQVGLASSSAIEVAAAVAMRGLLNVKMSDKELVRRLLASHRSFFEEIPNPADYIVALMARNDQFLVVDETDLSVTRIKSPFSRCKFILMDSRVPRFGVTSELANRRDDLKTGLEMLSQGREGANFREFAAMDLLNSMGDLPEEIRRRSLHVVQEIRRVLDAGDCLERADLTGFSRLIFQSHESLRNLYEVSCPEIDWMVKRAQETAGVLGARMTGLGFGGCTYTIIKNEAVGNYRERIDDYERIFSFHPGIYEVKLATGSRIVPN